VQHQFFGSQTEQRIGAWIAVGGGREYNRRQ